MMPARLGRRVAGATGRCGVSGDNPGMGTLFLVRHGQASFGAADYDQLSELGHRQCVRLGEHLAQRGVQFEATLTGTLRRHAQSLAGIHEGLGRATATFEQPGLNEYDSEAIVRAIHPGPIPAADTPERVRHHFRLLRQGLQAWMAGTSAPEGMPPHAALRGRRGGARWTGCARRTKATCCWCPAAGRSPRPWGSCWAWRAMR